MEAISQQTMLEADSRNHIGETRASCIQGQVVTDTFYLLSSTCVQLQTLCLGPVITNVWVQVATNVWLQVVINVWCKLLQMYECKLLQL